jgi:cytosine/adenosine deaminase-related metal-dependent hydrolase
MDWIYERIKELQARAGYLGDYHRWIKEHMPSRLWPGAARMASSARSRQFALLSFAGEIASGVTKALADGSVVIVETNQRILSPVLPMA